MGKKTEIKQFIIKDFKSFNKELYFKISALVLLVLILFIQIASIYAFLNVNRIYFEKICN